MGRAPKNPVSTSLWRGILTRSRVPRMSTRRKSRRVLLNLISNGFYAATRRALGTGDGFQPTLRATTKNLGNKIEIRIRDNGMGIAAEVKEKIFNPFFTTKPAGEGTGLGLSMSHDIVVKQHGGTIDVDTEPGIFTEFIITLPRTLMSEKTAGGSN